MGKRRKVLTKLEAIRLAWEIGHIVSGQEEKFALDVVSYEKDRDHKWCEFELHLSGSGFEIRDSFLRHDDGRIRDHSRSVENVLAFAQWYAKHFSDTNDAKEVIERLCDPALVAASIEDERVRKAFKKNTQGMSFIDDLDCELNLARLAV